MSTSVNQNSVKQAREALGARLRELRQQAGLTGKDLAESLGLAGYQSLQNRTGQADSYDQ
jgi:transcriptional regulator with XRE-family HTH domain